MKKKSWYKMLCIIIIFTMNIFLLPDRDFIINNVYADDVEPGDRIDIPSEGHPQHVIYEFDYGVFSLADRWADGTNQKALSKEWIKKGCKSLDDVTGICTMSVGGIDWLLVAVSEVFGEAGDYIKVHINNDGEEEDYYMIIADTKSPKDITAAFLSDGVHYGHWSDCRCL